MYCLWTGKICIFITVINFPNNNRHTTVFHEKAYFSTIMKYFLQDIIAPEDVKSLLQKICGSFATKMA